MKITIDILELYENVSEIPRNEESANWFNEGAIINKAMEVIHNDYFPANDAEMLVSNPIIKYLTFSNEYPSRIPDKVIFSVIPA